VAAAAIFAGTASAKLTAAEQKWATPLIQSWNLQNAGLHLVLAQASKNGALVAGEKPDNLNLTQTLVVLASCQSGKVITKAGKPPTARLTAFRDALNATCIHDSNGAQDFAKAIGAVSKNNTAKAKLFLAQGVTEFKKGSDQLQKAYDALTAIGGTNAFKA
jgi:hypothetical protein